ncbi:MAG: nucleotidyltransferase family protein [Deltaproteobacteria bacterium]|nr:nucleotidyltransferase family protein [Deltaproteobacteria bacterium]
MATLQQYIPAIFQVADRYGARKIRVFGSFIDGNADENSDLDLLIDLEQGRDLLDLIGFKQELEERIGRRVDVVTEKGLSPHLREKILSQARLL